MELWNIPQRGNNLRQCGWSSWACLKSFVLVIFDWRRLWTSLHFVMCRNRTSFSEFAQLMVCFKSYLGVLSFCRVREFPAILLGLLKLSLKRGFRISLKNSMNRCAYLWYRDIVGNAISNFHAIYWSLVLHRKHRNTGPIYLQVLLQQFVSLERVPADYIELVNYNLGVFEMSRRAWNVFFQRLWKQSYMNLFTSPIRNMKGLFNCWLFDICRISNSFVTLIQVIVKNFDGIWNDASIQATNSVYLAFHPANWNIFCMSTLTYFRHH